MKKQVLFGFVALTALSVNAQTSSKTITNLKAKKYENFKIVPIEGNVTSSKTSTLTSASKKVTSGFYNRIGSSSNAFGVYTDNPNPLSYNANINTVGFVLRASDNIWNSIGAEGNTGTIVFNWSSNNGTSWDSTILAASSSHLNRYPSGAIFNPAGNTVPANAYAVGSGPWWIAPGGSSWQGSFFASKQLGTGYTTVAGTTTYLDNLALVIPQKKHDNAYTDFQITSDGFAHVAGGIYTDVNNITSTPLRGYRGAMLDKGTFSAGSFTWTQDSLKPLIKLDGAGDKVFDETFTMAWSENGQIGYVCFLGVDVNAVAGTSQNSYQPYLFKTINGGVTWSHYSPLFNFATIPAIASRLIATKLLPALKKPFFSSSEGFNSTVDAAGDLHLFTSMGSAYSDHIDSLGYSYSPNYNKVWNYLVDLKTSGAGWSAMIVDSLSCERPTKVESSWTSSSGNLPYNSRLQISRTPDGNNIFYSWSDSDSNIVQSSFPHFNISPDVYMKGYDVISNKMTCKKNMTSGRVGIEYNAFFFYASPTVAKPTATSYLIPTTITQGDGGVNNGDVTVSHYYIGDNTFTQSEFTVTVNTPGCVSSTGVSVKEESTLVSSLNFYPNPASTNGTVDILLVENAKMELVVINSVGQVVYTTAVNGFAGSNKVNIDLNNLSNGLYFYQVNMANSKTVTKKFVVNK